MKALTYTPLVGRILLSMIFIMSGLHKLMDWEGTAQYMAAKGMPLVPIFLLGAVVFELSGGIMVLAGYRPRWGALMLIVFLIPTTLLFHNFWALEGQERQTQMINFLKNLAIMGGLFMVLFFGSGPVSVTRHSQPPASGG